MKKLLPYDSEYLISSINFIISWFSLIIVAKIIFPIFRGSDIIEGSINSGVIGSLLGWSFGHFLVFYYPIKLIVLIFNKKHKWPTGWGYHILPWMFMFLSQYLMT